MTQQAQVCQLCQVQGIKKLIPPSQAKAHKMRMHPETVPTSPAQAPPAEPVPKRRGRPPKHGVAMTAAERKAASRAWQKEEQQDAERRKLVAELLIIEKRNLAKPGGETITELGKDRIRSANRQYLQTLHDNLLHQSIDALRKSLKALEELPDSHGRLHNERSGEAERSMGQSEMEKLDNARRHDTGLFEVDDPEAATQEAKQMAAGFQVTPQGAGPDVFDTSEDDEVDKPSSSPKPNWTPTAHEKWRIVAINNIIHKMNFKFDSPGTRKCPFCSETFLVSDSAARHFEEQYGKDVRAYEKWVSFGSALYQLHLTAGAPLVDPGLPPNVPHSVGIEEEVERLRKQARKKPKKP